MKSSLSATHVLRKALALLSPIAGLLVCQSARAQAIQQQIKTVWVIDLENRNFTQPASVNATLAPLLGNSAAPYINSLITSGSGNPATPYVSYGTAYHNVLAGPTGPIAPAQAWTFSSLDVHPSEPNYLWQESGLNLGIFNDNDPYGAGLSVQAIANYLAANPAASGQNLCGLLQAAGIPWMSYQEGIDLVPTSGSVNQPGSNSLTNTVAAQSLWTVPLASFSGTSASYTNPYNGSHQYNFACKHDGTLFFSDTNGTTSLTVANFSTSNPEVPHYAPLEQLATDLANGTCGSYNLITPDQYNDMHTALSGGYTYPATATHYTGDLAQIAQGDNFLSIIIPEIMASPQWKNNGAIIIWTDETEGSNSDAFPTTLLEIVISPLAVGNAFNVTDDVTHSSDLATLQDIFHVTAKTPTGYLNDAANVSNGTGTSNLADFFQPGVIVQDTNIPAMPWWALMALALLILSVTPWFMPKKKVS